ncbi:MAG: hypothetical protein P4L33_13080 [Capsulimonadaceae bacterium]|nr:hypothetical protein [Capsulimonadaceae bacterium]
MSSSAHFVSVNGIVSDNPRVRIDGLSDRDYPILNELLDPNSTFPLSFGAFPLSFGGKEKL